MRGGRSRTSWSEDEPAVPAVGEAAARRPQRAAPAAAARDRAAPAQEQVLHSLSCPQCAGPLSVRAGRRILLCGHCGVRVLVSGGRRVLALALPPEPRQAPGARPRPGSG